MWPYFPLSITNKPREWCQGARESEGGWWWGRRVREKAEHKHNSNRNQLEPSKLFICQMDTFPRDFTLKHDNRAPRTRAFQKGSMEIISLYLNCFMSDSDQVWRVGVPRHHDLTFVLFHRHREGGTCSLSSIFKEVGTVMTFSEGYYTNHRLLRDVCHTQYITDACLRANQGSCHLKKIYIFKFFLILDF